MPYPPSQPGVYGLARPTSQVAFSNVMAFTGFTSGTPVTVPFGPVMFLAVISNQYQTSTVVQTGVTWTKVVDGGLFGGAYAVASLWVGVASASATSSLTITQVGNNQQSYMIGTIAGISGISDNTGVALTNSTTASIGVIRGRIAFVVYFARGGTLVGPSEAGWRNLATNYATGYGPVTVAWRIGSAGAATITGRTDNSIELLAGLL